jgi:hypothetical protein
MCESELPAASDAIYERASRTVRCLACVSVPEVLGEEPRSAPDELPRAVDLGVPGASARREYERRHARRQERIRTEHRRLGGLILAMSADPQSTRAWDTGALGEERLGARLNELADDSLRVLHDRRIPGSRANIDHLAVTRSGVFVIDAKRYQGRPRLVVEGGLIRQRVERLLVGRRDCTKLVDGLLKQVDVVRGVVGNAAVVHGVLCFVEADWPLVGGSFTTRGADVLWPRKLYQKLSAGGPLSVEDVSRLHQQLGDALPPAR